MVVPILIGAARVAGGVVVKGAARGGAKGAARGGSKAAAQSGTRGAITSSSTRLTAEGTGQRNRYLNRTNVRRGVRAYNMMRSHDDDHEETPLSDNQKIQKYSKSPSVRQGTRLLNRFAKKLQRTPSNASANLKRIQAASTAMMIFWSAIAFVTAQVTFWLVGLGFLGTKLTPVVGDWIPGEVVYIFCWFLIATIGICTMVFATIMFTIRGVNCFGGMKGMIFIFCIAGYCTFFINFFPWFVIWIFSVALLQKEDE